MSKGEKRPEPRGTIEWCEFQGQSFGRVAIRVESLGSVDAPDVTLKSSGGPQSAKNRPRDRR